MRTLAAKSIRRPLAIASIAGSDSLGNVTCLVRADDDMTAGGASRGDLFIGHAGGTVTTIAAASNSNARVLFQGSGTHSTLHLACRSDGTIAASAVGESIALIHPDGTQTALAQGRDVNPEEAHGSEGLKLQFLPDGRLVSAGRQLQVWDLATGVSVTIGHAGPDSVFSCLAVVGHALVATSSSSGQLSLWDLSQSEPRLSVNREGAVTALRKCGDRKILVGDVTGTIDLISLDDLQLIERFRWHSKAVTCLSCDSDERAFASASVDGTLSVGAPGTSHPLAVIAGSRGQACEAVYFMNHDDTLVWQTDGYVLSTQWRSSELSKQQLGELDSARGAATASGAPSTVAYGIGHVREVTQIIKLRDGEEIATVGRDGVLCSWSLSDGSLRARYALHGDPINAIADLGDFRVATGADDEVIVVTQLKSGNVLRISHKQKFEPGQVGGLWPGPTGNVISCSKGGKNDLFLWDSTTGKRQLFPRLEEPEQAQVVSVLALSAGLEFLSMDELGGVTSWKRNSKLASTWFGEGRGWCFAPDGAAAYIGDGPVHRIDLRIKKSQGVYRAAGKLTQFSADPSGQWVLCQAEEASTIYDAHSQAPAGVLPGHHHVCAWSPSGRLLALASDKELCVWSTELCAVVERVQHHESISALAVPNDAQVAVGDACGGLQIYLTDVVSVLDEKAAEAARIAEAARLEREAKEQAERAREAKAREAREAKEREAREREAKAREAREAKEREAREREAKAREAREAKEREAREAEAREARERELQAREEAARKLREDKERAKQLAREKKAQKAQLVREKKAQKAQLAREKKAQKKLKLELAREKKAQKAQLVREKKAQKAQLAREKKAQKKLKLQQLREKERLKAQALRDKKAKLGARKPSAKVTRRATTGRVATTEALTERAKKGASSRSRVVKKGAPSRSRDVKKTASSRSRVVKKGASSRSRVAKKVTPVRSKKSSARPPASSTSRSTKKRKLAETAPRPRARNVREGRAGSVSKASTPSSRKATKPQARTAPSAARAPARSPSRLPGTPKSRPSTRSAKGRKATSSRKPGRN